MSKLSKVERLREVARANQAKLVARERQETDELAATLQGISDLVQEYGREASEVDSAQALSLHRRFYGELYRTYVAQGERLHSKERMLAHEVSELRKRHKHLTLLRNLLKKREDAHKYAERKKIARAQIHRTLSKL